MNTHATIIALLRGINVGGHHKVAMKDLCQALKDIGLEKPRTILNSGNALFETAEKNLAALEITIETHLAQVFGFPIPVILRSQDKIAALVAAQPFQAITTTKDTRLYVSFLKHKPSLRIELPFLSADKSYQIISIHDSAICSVLDLAITNSPKGMDELEKLFGKEITTRNWNTVLKLAAQ